MTVSSGQSCQSGRNGVVVPSGGSPANTLGVIRAFGRRNIPVVYLDSQPSSFIRYSRYITTRLKIGEPRDSEREYVDVLLDFGRKTNGRMMIVPTGDGDVLTLAKYKQELEKFFVLPVSSYEKTEKLVNKKKFYRWLARENIPHPKTHFPENTDALKAIGLTVPFPYIIKPAYSLGFQIEFGQKSFAINSVGDLDHAIKRLQKAPPYEVMIQEIIPGKDIYSFYTYLGKKSDALAICGYDKIRQWPVDFGTGTFCISRWRPSLIRQCVELLQTIGYHGFAEPELKRDPRDGQYKLIEINARTTLLNRLPASCGTDIEYAAYLDGLGDRETRAVYCRQGVSWVDDIPDLLSLLAQVKGGQTRISDFLSSFKPRTVHSIASLRDPTPFMIHLVQSAFRRVKRLAHKRET